LQLSPLYEKRGTQTAYVTMEIKHLPFPRSNNKPPTLQMILKNTEGRWKIEDETSEWDKCERKLKQLKKLKEQSGLS
jgi:hypothetical protein